VSQLTSTLDLMTVELFGVPWKQWIEH